MLTLGGEQKMGAVQWDKKCHNMERPSVRLTVRLGNKWHSYYSRGCGGKIETSAIDFYVMYKVLHALKEI